MYQGIAKTHSPNWFPEDKEKLEKVLMELWPNSKINPRKMYFYIENVKAFYPEVVHEAISRIVATQEYDRRPTINKLRTECQMLVRDKYGEKQGEQTKEDCGWCGYHSLVHVGLYIESPEKCKALDIQGKNVLMAKDGWIVRPDWGHELELTLKEYMVHCPQCSPPHKLVGLRSARSWMQRYYHFTEFRCSNNGSTPKQWSVAYRRFHQMIRQQPTGELNMDQIRKADSRFHEYLDSLPDNDVFEKRKMNVIDKEEEQPREGDRADWREEEMHPQAEATQGTLLHDEDEGLAEEAGLPSGDSREDSADSDEGRQG